MSKSAVSHIPKNSVNTKAHNFTGVEEIINITNQEIIEDVLYIADDIFIPEKKDIARCYRSDFTLKTREEAKKLFREDKRDISKYKNTDFFVYNERTKDILPFKKNDYLIYEHGYFTFDGKSYISYDDNGNEIGRF